jgi:hypothetical protein
LREKNEQGMLPNEEDSFDGCHVWVLSIGAEAAS